MTTEDGGQTLVEEVEGGRGDRDSSDTDLSCRLHPSTVFDNALEIITDTDEPSCLLSCKKNPAQIPEKDMEGVAAITAVTLMGLPSF